MIRKVLIADDSPIARKILKSCFPRDRDFEFHEVGDGAAAVEKYVDLRPDVTFLDLTMPVMDGIKALEKIRELDKNALVVIATADVQKRTLERVRELGAFVLLRKPPSKETVLNALIEIEKAIDERK